MNKLAMMKVSLAYALERVESASTMIDEAWAVISDLQELVQELLAEPEPNETSSESVNVLLEDDSV